jgi:hypothetical protein
MFDFVRRRLLRRGSSPNEVAHSPEPHGKSHPPTPFDRFLRSPTDARGYIALSLFLKSHIESGGSSSADEVAQKISALTGETLQTLYKSSGQRILEHAFNELSEKQASRDLQQSALLVEVAALIDEKHRVVSAEMETLQETLREGLSLRTQIFVVTSATLIVTIAVWLLTSLPEPLRRLIHGEPG